MAHISPEAALVAFRQAYSEVADTNVLLRARVTELEKEVETLREQLPDPVTPESPGRAAAADTPVEHGRR